LDFIKMYLMYNIKYVMPLHAIKTALTENSGHLLTSAN